MRGRPPKFSAPQRREILAAYVARQPLPHGACTTTGRDTWLGAGRPARAALAASEPAWAHRARELRARGWTLARIGGVVGVSRQRVGQVLKNNHLG